MQRTAVFSGMSRLQQSCVPNAYLVVEDADTGRRRLLVSSDISEGEPISIDYQVRGRGAD